MLEKSFAYVTINVYFIYSQGESYGQGLQKENN